MENSEIGKTTYLYTRGKKCTSSSIYSSVWNSKDDNEENIGREVEIFFAGLIIFFTKIGRHAVTNCHARTYWYFRVFFERRKCFGQIVEVDRRVHSNISGIKNWY